MLRIRIAQASARLSFLNADSPITMRLSLGPGFELLHMLYYIGSFLLLIWFVLKFVMHRGGFVHTLLLAGIGVIAVQFVQHLRTRQYERTQRR